MLLSARAATDEQGQKVDSCVSEFGIVYPTVVIVVTLHHRPSSTPSRYSNGNSAEFVCRSTAHTTCPDTKMARTRRQISVKEAMLKFEEMLFMRSGCRAAILVTKENPSLRPTAHGKSRNYVDAFFARGLE